MFVQIEDLTRENWTPLRTFVNQIDEMFIPPASAFITLDYQDKLPKRIEFAFENLSNNHNAQQMSFIIWRLQGGRIDKIAVISYARGTECDCPIPQILEINGATVYVTHNEGDTNVNRTISGSVYCRIIEQ
jgi:hypothetical protein